MKNMIKNWETSVVGLLLIIAGCCLTFYVGDGMDEKTGALAAGLVLSGIAALRSRDGNKTSEDVGAK